MKIIVILCIIIAGFLGKNLSAQTVNQPLCPIIPTPVVYQVSNGNFNFSDEFIINTTNLPSEIGNYLQDQLKNSFAISSKMESNGGEINFKKSINVPKDSYSITVTESITITYSSDESCFYAVNSLLQLIDKGKLGYFIKKCFISDLPKFEWRGLHLDVSRHFYTVEEVKRFIDLMGLYKFNTFHWHLTDDQGWRIEIKQFPKLTEIGAWRDSTLIGHYNDQPRKYEHKRVGGFYTQEQIKDVVQYAQNRYISVVPEIEMPGHSRAALAAYPEYSCNGIQQGVPGIWGIFDDIYCSKPETLDFLKRILDEVIVLFPSPYIHIGGDEAPKTRWHACDKCQKTIKDNGLKDEHELQSYFIRQMDAYLTSKGKKIIGWDEILEGGLSPNASVMSWRGEEGGIEAAKQKHYVVMSPSGYCYFDHYQSGNANEPVAIGGYLPLEKVYKFNPIPEGLTTEEQYYILGGQANLWTEYIPTMQHLEYMTYPRALALAQSLWCREQKPSYENFLTVLLNKQLYYLDKHKVNYSKAIFYPAIQIKRNDLGLSIKFSSVREEYDLDIISNNYNYDSRGEIKSIDITKYTKDSTKISRDIEHSSFINFTVTLPSNITKIPESSFSILQHSAIGLPVELITQPNKKFNVRGDLALVDGIKGKRPWKGDEWLGFTNDTIVFIVDLTGNKKIKRFKLGFLEAKGSWIYLPESIQLSISNDKQNWTDLKKEKVSEEFIQKVNKKGQYIRVTVFAKDKIAAGSDGEGNDPWTFMDEVEIDYK